MKKINKKQLVLFITWLVTFTFLPAKLFAQIPEPNETGVSTGHIHLTVPDLAKHSNIWKSLGAKISGSGRLTLYTFPGMIFLLTEREPTAPSRETSVNHVGFLVQDYADIKTKLEAAGSTFVIDNEENGQLIAELPDGVRVEMQQSDDISNPIEFHHIHLVAKDQEGLRDWYVKTFGAEVSSRRNMPSAVVPGGRVDVMGVRGDTPKSTKGTAIDHIGFEVADMDAFIERLKTQGVKIDLGPIEAPAIGLKVAFITDPVGTYIEITEGLDNLD